MQMETEKITNQFTFNTVGTLMGKIHRAMKRFMEGQMKNFNITPPQFEVLLTLWETDRRTLNELGKLLARDGPTITGIIDRLENKGLVQRKRDSADRRCIRVELTPKAHGLRDEMTRRLQNSFSDIAGNFSEIEMRQLEHILQKMLINIEQIIVPRMHSRIQ
jgi:DNA-binding MarR family transcriptional regulator